MKIVVASTNPVKVEVAIQAFEKVFPNQKIEVIGVKSNSDVPDQPFNEEVLIGAQNRLKYIKKIHPDADFWIAQEGGLFNENDTIFNRAWIIVCDKDGNIGKSSTSSFYIPKKVIEYIKQGDELAIATSKFLNEFSPEQKEGGTAMITNNIINRTNYYLNSAIIALCQVIHRDWY